MSSTQVTTNVDCPARLAGLARWQVALVYLCAVGMAPIFGMAILALLATLLPAIVLAVPFVAGSAWELGASTAPRAPRARLAPPTAGPARLRPALGSV